MAPQRPGCSPGCEAAGVANRGWGGLHPWGGSHRLWGFYLARARQGEKGLGTRKLAGAVRFLADSLRFSIRRLYRAGGCRRSRLWGSHQPRGGCWRHQRGSPRSSAGEPGHPRSDAGNGVGTWGHGPRIPVGSGVRTWVGLWFITPVSRC